MQRVVKKMQRIGIGYDIHKLTEGRKLILGGVEIPHPKGLLGHSDADVVIHALCDALLGALGKGDIGELFPDTDQRFKDISSFYFLEEIKKLADCEGWQIGNVDIIVIADEPSLRTFKLKIKYRLSEILNIDSCLINVKAKTKEGLSTQSITAHAAVLISKKLG